MRSSFLARTNLTLLIFSSLVGMGCSRFNGQTEIPTQTQIQYEAIDENGRFISKTKLENDDQPPATPEELENLEKQSQKLGENTSEMSLKNRIHIVFVGDGYTKSELPQFAKDVENNKKIFLSQQPFKAYAKHFAFHRVDLASPISLSISSNEESPQATSLGMYYGCHGIERLLCIDVDKVKAITKKFPKVHAVFALANSSRYGGAGYTSPPIATLAARNPASTELALHEFGHSFAGLTDEYETSGPSVDCNKYANTSRYEKASMQADHLKWYRWLDLPHVGTYPGSCYAMNFYRPTENSKMRSLGAPFEEINNEQFIMKFYAYTNPVDSYQPSNEKTLKGHQVFNLNTLDPVESPLQIEWSLDGKILASLQGLKKLATNTLNLKKGTYKFQVKITDPSLRIRDEKFRSESMSKSILWKVKIP